MTQSGERVSLGNNAKADDLLERSRYHAGTAEELLKSGDHTGDFAEATAHAALTNYYLEESLAERMGMA